MQDARNYAYAQAEDTDANNELINDGQFVQPLTAEEIEALKRSGVDASVRPISFPP